MFRVSREIDFCYGHRLLNYDGKCKYLHGHNGRAIITIESCSVSSASSGRTNSPSFSGRHWPFAPRMKALPQMLTTMPRGVEEAVDMGRTFVGC